MKITPFSRSLATLSLSLVLLLSPTPSLTSAADAKWSEVPLPQTGAAGGWILAPDTDVTHLESDSQGRLYAWVTGVEGGLFRADASGENFIRLYSSDHIPVSLIMADKGHIYYATETTLYRSTDGGLNFQIMASQPGGPGKRITGFEVHSRTATDLIAVSVADDDIGEWGGVYLYDEADFFGGWMDANVGSYDVLDISFSPTFDTDRTLLALATDGSDTFIMIFSAGTWRSVALKHSDSSSVPATSGILAMPLDFNITTNPQLYVAIDTGGADSGGVWLCYVQPAPQSPVAFALPVNIDGDFTSLSVNGTTGNYQILAGTDSTGILHSTDGGITWQPADRKPNGDAVTGMLGLGSELFTATSGSDSGMFRSSDGGLNWSPVALIDANGAGTLVKVMASPAYATDNTLYLMGFNGGHGLWRTADSGDSWRKIISTGDYGINTIEQINTADDGTLFVAATDDTGGICLISPDRGDTFSIVRLPAAIDSAAGFVVADKDHFYFTSFDGTIARVWRGGNGLFFENIAVGDVVINALEISPYFNIDRTMVAATSDGSVYISLNAGVSFSALPALSLSGSIRLTFAPDFGTSGKLYSTSDTADAGIHQLTIGDTDWSRIDSGLPTDTILNDIVISADGVVYASNYTQVSATTGGLVRALSDSSTWCLTRAGLPNGATLEGLSINGHQLWSMDTTNDRIMTYTDTISAAVSLVSPVSVAPGLGNYTAGVIIGIDLTWQSISGATGYEWQLNNVANMSAPLLSGSTTAASTRLNTLDPGITYYWQVRAATPVPGPWSEKRSFTTALGGAVTVPQLITPVPGAADLGIKPLFQWHPVSGAAGYELILAADSGFVDVVSAPGNIENNVWQPQTALDPEKTYYWKVRAISASSFSAWSAVSAFVVAPESAPSGTTPLTIPPPSTTGPIQPMTMALPEWLGLTLAGMGGAVVLLLLALVVAVRGRRIL